jgi:2-deoxy-D-gluconate 3-dehydrogenase
MGLEMFSLEGKTALVTGASRGIGAAIAIAYAEAGADVALAARTVDALEDVEGKIAATGRRAVVIPTDVTDVEQVDACVARAIAELGRIDVMVNNAGGSDFIAPVTDTKIEGWHKRIDLNLHSVFYGCRAVGPHMTERGSGSVINVASLAAFTATPMMAFYGAAKAGVVSMTKTIAHEWGAAGVRVNAICPGWIKTELNRLLWDTPELAPKVIANQAIRRWGETDDLLGAAIWLASDASRFTTGESILIDGGLASGGFSLGIG